MNRLAVALAFAVIGVGYGLHGGQSDYPPCSPGWHRVPAPITAVIGACADTSTKRGCVHFRGDSPPHSQTFIIPSCDPNGRNADGG